MQSGQGEEGPDDVYRPMPLPQEPQAPSGSEPREGIVLPSKGGRWVPPSRRQEPAQDQWEQQPAPAAPPAQGQPWGQSQPDPYAGQQPPPYGATPPPPSYGGETLPAPYGDAGLPAAYGDATLPAPHGDGTLPAPYGEPPAPAPAPQDAQATQLLAPYDPHNAPQGPPQHLAGGQAPGTPGGGYDGSYGGHQPLLGGDADRTQMLAPYGQPPLPGGDADRTQMLAPYGQQQPGGDADRTQMLAPYPGHAPEAAPQAPDGRAPLPPEQRFDAPLPPMPQAPPHDAQQYAPPMPGGAPFAIRPGAPGDPSAGHQDNAPATQALPPFDNDWQQQAPGAQPAQTPAPAPADDYDYLYRRDDAPARRPAPPARVTGAFPQQAPPAPQPQYQGHGGDHGRGGGGRGGQGGRGGGKKLSTPVLIGIGVLVVAVIGVGIDLASGGGSSPSAAPSVSASAPGTGTGAAGSDAQGQAKQLDALLKTSNSSRTSVINAVSSIKSCDNLSASAATLRAAARERDDLVTQLSGMTLSALPNSDSLIGQLKAAWKASAAADNYYAQWGDQTGQPKGCKKHHAKITLAVERGNVESGKATLAKQKAADLWNPIAQQYGLTQRQYTQL